MKKRILNAAIRHPERSRAAAKSKDFGFARRIAKTALAVVLCVGLLPTGAITAWAADGDTAGDASTTPKTVVTGTQALTAPTAATDSSGTVYTPTSYVYLGAFEQDSTTDGAEPILWRVLSTSGNTTSNGTATYTDSTGAAYSGSAIYLLSEYTLSSNVKFNTSNSNGNEYQGSNAQAWARDFAGDAGAATNVADAFTTAERTSILATTKTDADGKLYDIGIRQSALASDYVFFPSAAELSAFVGSYSRASGLAATSSAGTAQNWWTRTSHESATQYAVYVKNEGSVQTLSVSSGNSARPALNLNGSQIVLTSAADASAETSFAAVSDYADYATDATAGWKLTLADGNNFSTDASIAETTIQQTGSITITHAALSTFTDAGYDTVTAQLTDSSDTVVAYGSGTTTQTEGGTTQTEDGAAQTTFTVPETIPAGTYTLTVRAEDWNGAKATNIASGTAFTQTIEVIEKKSAAAPTATINTTETAYYVQGQTATTLSVEASTEDGGTLSYQWWWDDSGYGRTSYSSPTSYYYTSAAIEGATGQTYTPPTDELGTKWYWCVVTNTLEDALGEKTATTQTVLVKVVVGEETVMSGASGLSAPRAYSSYFGGSNSNYAYDVVYLGSYPQSAYTPTTVPKSPQEDVTYTDTDGTQFVYVASSDGSGGSYYKCEPIKWLVLDDTPSGRVPIEGTELYEGTGEGDYSASTYLKLNSWNEGDGFVLISENILDVHIFTEGVGDKGSTTWAASDLRTWLNADFANTAFTTAAEKAALLSSAIDYPSLLSGHSVIDGQGDEVSLRDGAVSKLFVLSRPEAESGEARFGQYRYFCDYNIYRVAHDTAYSARDYSTISAGDAGSWWLRDTVYDNTGRIQEVRYDGQLAGGDGDYWSGSEAKYTNGVRPATNLDASTVIRMQAADNRGRSESFMPVETYADTYNFNNKTGYDYLSEWKLTLADSAASITGSVSGTTELSEGYADTTLAVSHTALSAIGAAYTNITATLENEEGGVLYYGSINADASATSSSVTIPAGLEPGTYTLSVRGEDWNAENYSDYATADAITATITVGSFITSQPVSASYTVGDTAAALSVGIDEGVAAANDLSYQWYKSTTGSRTNAALVSGATEASYTPSTASAGTSYYYCVVTATPTGAGSGGTGESGGTGGSGAGTASGGARSATSDAAGIVVTAQDATPRASKAIVSGISGMADPADGGSLDWLYLGLNKGSTPVQWRVLSTSGSGGTYSDGESAVESTDALFLMSEYLLEGGVVYSEKREWESWSGSNAQAWVQDFAGISGSQVTNAFSATELASLLETSKAENDSSLSNEKIFLLSLNEINSYVKSRGSAAATFPGKNTTGTWWTRYPTGTLHGTNNYSAYLWVGEDFRVTYYLSQDLDNFSDDIISAGYAMRPALNLNINDVVFTSAAAGAKNASFGAIAAYAGTEWKATLADSAAKISGSVTGSTVLSEGYESATLNVGHTALSAINAQAGSSGGFDHITAALTNDAGELVYYGAINADETATTSVVTIPAGLSLGTYTLSVRAEDWNGAYMSDYATSDAITAQVVVTDVPKSEPVVSANDIAWTYTGSAVPDTAISGTASFGGESVSGTWSFKSGPYTDVSDSADEVAVVFTPTDTDAYTAVEDTVKLTISPAALSASGTASETAVYGTPLSEVDVPALTVTFGGSEVAGSWAWDFEASGHAADAVLDVSDTAYALTAVFTPSEGAGNFTTLRHAVSLRVTKAAAPQITWPSASEIRYGDALSQSQLSGGSTEYGEFSWTDPSLILGAGDKTASVTFTANDATQKNYEAVTPHTHDVSITVLRAWPAVSVAAGAVSVGESACTMTLTAKVTGVAGSGGSGTSGLAAPSGTVEFQARLADDGTGEPGQWFDIGTATLDTTTGEATFEWKSAAKNTIYEVSVAYPGDDNYEDITCEPLAVNTALQNQSIAIASPGTKTYGDADFTLALSNAGETGATGAVTWASSDTQVVTVDEATGVAHIVGAGEAVITAAKAADSAYNGAEASCTIMVGKLALSAAADSLSKVAGEADPAFTYTLTSALGTGTAALATGDTLAGVLGGSLACTHSDEPGSYPITQGTLALTSEGAANYTLVFTEGTFTILTNSIAGATVTTNPSSCTYTGSAITPAVTVVFNGKTLAVGTDYTVAYSNNVNVGMAIVTVTGAGIYSGTATGSFTIVAAPDPVTPTPTPTPTVESQAMYRLYNPNSGEHFYTANEDERSSLIVAGWDDEGIGWYAPVTSNTPVFRMYNSTPSPVTGSGEHHYTTSAAERDSLVAAGWEYEGIGWYSDDAQGTPLYRVYNPNEFNNNHHYTTSTAERDNLISIGWRDEGIAWYGV